MEGVEATATLRATGTGHGLAKIALVVAIIAHARTVGKREIELYLYELFHKASQTQSLTNALVDFNAANDKPKQYNTTPCFSLSMMSSYGHCLLGPDETVTKNGSRETSRWFNHMRTHTLLCLNR
eukprot:1065659-Amphidinium_carterae.2